MSFNKLLEKLKSAQQAQASTLVKSAPAAYPLSTQSLDTALKSCKSMGHGPETEKLLKDLHAAGCAAGIPDADLEGHIAGHMRRLAGKKPITKSLTPGEALSGQIQNGEAAAQFDPASMTVDAGTTAAHLAVTIRRTDQAFIRELTDAGVSISDRVQVEQILENNLTPPEHREVFYNAVRQRVSAAGEPVSPAVRGIEW